MDSTTGSLLVPAYFLQIIVGTGVLAWWFMSRKDALLRTFGLGMAGYAAGVAAWTLLVLLKPENLQPLILVGAIPFLLAHIAYAKVAYKHLDYAKMSLLSVLVLGTIAGTFVVRTFLYPSQPYFSDKGLLYFGLHPVSIAFYIATISMTFLPAISVVASKIKNKSLKSTVQIGLTTIFLNAIILVSGTNDTLLLINGVVMTVALLAVWVRAVTADVKSL